MMKETHTWTNKVCGHPRGHGNTWADRFGAFNHKDGLELLILVLIVNNCNRGIFKKDYEIWPKTH